MKNTKETGNIGEGIASNFLINNGFYIIDRNYFRKWGEIDIVAKMGEQLHFFEVKSVAKKFYPTSFNFHKPEENVHSFKKRQLRRIIETYLFEKGYGYDCTFQFHVLCIFLDQKTRLAHVEWIKNVIL